MFFLISFLSLLLHSRAQGCSTTGHFNETLKVYYDWPFAYRCLSDVDHHYYYDFINEEYSCIITEMTSKQIVFNSTFTPLEELPFLIDSVTESTPKYYEMRLQQNTSRWFKRVTLDPSRLVSESCEENLRRMGAIDIESTSGHTFQASCKIPDDAIDIPKRLVEDTTNSTKIFWLYNCQESLPQNAMLGEAYRLDITNISFESNPGVYTCVVQHNGMRRYRIHQKICVAQRISSETSIKCSNQIVAIGEDAVVECIVDGGVGVVSDVVFHGEFVRLNSSGESDSTQQNPSCVTYVGKTGHERDERFSCELSTEVKKICFDTAPTEKELESQKTSYSLRYRIQDVRESDIGAYRATIVRASIRETTTFHLIYDRKRGLSNSNRLLTICLAASGGVALLSLIVWKTCSVEIRWIWFRTCKPVEKGCKSYVAYLAYYYNKDMSVTQPSNLEAFVTSLGRTLQKNGGDIFDRCRDPTTCQYTAGSISARLSQCHRVVIILTPEYIHDQWSVYEAYEAWKSVIENDLIKIIFILFPSTMSAINELPKNSRTTIKKALKRHSAIDWDGTLPLSRKLRITLRLLMPKFDLKEKFEKFNGNKPNVQASNANGNIYTCTV